MTNMGLAPIEIDRLEKIARMVLFDVAQVNIAKAVGLSEGRVSQIIATEEFGKILEELAADKFDQHETLNDGWDNIEALALKNVIEVLQHNMDPDFSLHAAAMANRAQRRGRIGNQPIDGRQGARAVFHLTANFIDKLQQNKVIVNGEKSDPDNVLSLQTREHRDDLVQKDSNFLAPDGVEKLLLHRKKEEVDLDFVPMQAKMEM